VPPHTEIAPNASTGSAMAYVLRRSSDVTLAMLLLFLFAPFFLVVALLIKLSNCGPIFFYSRGSAKISNYFRF
jgi:lipopolysaccharide/colanic/teichoic acid biosynthesis glycosyltransferase